MKIIIKPNFWGVGLDIIELDLQNIVDLLTPRTRLPFKKISNRLDSIISLVIKTLGENRYTEGPSSGGWAKDFGDRYFNEMYPDGLPNDLMRYPDTISGTAASLDALKCLFDATKTNQSLETKMFFNKIFKEARIYLKIRCSDGEAGLYMTTAGEEGVIAKNLRHTAAASLAWFRVQGGEEILLSLLSALVKKLKNGHSYTLERGYSIGCILGALYLTRDSNIVRPHIPITDKHLDAIIGSAECSLLNRFNDDYCLWDLDNDKPSRLSIWCTLWILKWAFALGYSKNLNIRSMYKSVIFNMINHWTQQINNTEGIPMIPGGSPDISATSLLLESIRLGPLSKDKSMKWHITKMTDFLVDYGDNSKYLVHNYSWAQSNLITALLADSAWDIYS